jgi:hypothetical protein
MKKKINRVGNLTVEYIKSNTIDIVELFKIFEPYVNFKKNNGDPNPTRLIKLDMIEHAGEYDNLLGQLNFTIKPSLSKVKNIRNFRTHEHIVYGVWLYNHYKDEIFQHSSIYFSSGIHTRIYNNLSMYHFLREMRKLVPDCLTRIEMLMFKRV